MLRLAVKLALVVGFVSQSAFAQRLPPDVLVLRLGDLVDGQKRVVCSEILAHGLEARDALERSAGRSEAAVERVRELVAAIERAERALAQPDPNVVGVLIDIGALGATVVAASVSLTPVGAVAVGTTLVAIQVGNLIYYGSSSDLEAVAPALSLAGTATLTGFALAASRAVPLFRVMSIVQSGLLDTFSLRGEIDRVLLRNQLEEQRAALAAVESVVLEEDERMDYLRALVDDVRAAVGGPCAGHVAGVPTELR